MMQNQDSVKSAKFDNWNIQRVFEGHTQAVKSSVFSRDEKHIISGSADGSIRIWDINTAEAVKNINKKAGEINSISLSPAGDLLLWGTMGKTVLQKLLQKKISGWIKSSKGKSSLLLFLPTA